ncbi:MAG TPA: TatD family hydrolase [Vicinamibacterales bacterium]|nr:TatD family hydrolase [Vicinamibacterales bacterium]
MVDSHCHLADDAFEPDLDDVVARARAAGLTAALCILAAEDDAEAGRARRVAGAWDAVRFAAGVHPHQAGAFAGRPLDAAAAARARGDAFEGCAVGEIGLDYHYDFAPRDVQQEVFAAQIALARERRQPVIIHTREATEDTFAILREAGGHDLRGVFHCFTGDAAMARRALDIGFYVSFSGIATFPRAPGVREAARVVPDDRLLVETDSPYLAPVPLRGQRNEPAHVVRVAEVLAELRGRRAVDVEACTTRNVDVLFGPTPRRATA